MSDNSFRARLDSKPVGSIAAPWFFLVSPCTNLLIDKEDVTVAKINKLIAHTQCPCISKKLSIAWLNHLFKLVDNFLL